MSTAIARQDSPREQEALSTGELPRLAGAVASGMRCLAKRLDAELEHAHGLPMTSYEVPAFHLQDASGGAHAHVRPGRGRRSCHAAG